MGQQIGVLDTLYNYLSPAKEGDRFRLELVSFASPPPPKGGGFRSDYPKLISQMKGSKSRQ